MGDKFVLIGNFSKKPGLEISLFPPGCCPNQHFQSEMDDEWRFFPLFWFGTRNVCQNLVHYLALFVQLFGLLAGSTVALAHSLRPLQIDFLFPVHRPHPLPAPPTLPLFVLLLSHTHLFAIIWVGSTSRCILAGREFVCSSIKAGRVN